MVGWGEYDVDPFLACLDGSVSCINVNLAAVVRYLVRTLLGDFSSRDKGYSDIFFFWNYRNFILTPFKFGRNTFLEPVEGDLGLGVSELLGFLRVFLMRAR